MSQDVQELARSFRTLMWGILLLIILNVAAGIVQAKGAQDLGVSLGLLGASLCIGIFLVIQVIRVTKALGWGTVATVLCSIAMFIPCISLITLLVINQASVKVLKAAGYKVGLMGAKI